MQHSHHGDWGHQMRRAHRHPEGWTVSGLAQGIFSRMEFEESVTERMRQRWALCGAACGGLDDLNRRRFGLALPVGKVTSQMNRLLQIAALKVGYTRLVEASSGLRPPKIRSRPSAWL